MEEIHSTREALFRESQFAAERFCGPATPLAGTVNTPRERSREATRKITGSMIRAA